MSSGRARMGRYPLRIGSREQLAQREHRPVQRHVRDHCVDSAQRMGELVATPPGPRRTDPAAEGMRREVRRVGLRRQRQDHPDPAARAQAGAAQAAGDPVHHREQLATGDVARAGLDRGTPGIDAQRGDHRAGEQRGHASCTPVTAAHRFTGIRSRAAGAADEEHDDGERDDAVDHQQRGADRVDPVLMGGPRRRAGKISAGVPGPGAEPQRAGQFRTVDEGHVVGNRHLAGGRDADRLAEPLRPGETQPADVQGRPDRPARRRATGPGQPDR